MAWTICSSVPVTFLDTTGEPTNHSVAFPKATYSFVLREIRRLVRVSPEAVEQVLMVHDVKLAPLREGGRG